MANLAAELHQDPAYMKLLKTIAVSDANHDFDAAFRELYAQNKDIGTPYPALDVAPIGQGWDVVKMVAPSRDVPSFQALAPGPTIYRFNSVSGYQYDLQVFEETDLVGTATFCFGGKAPDINIIYDATANQWFNTTVKLGYKAPTLGTFTVLTNRETVADPGCKPVPCDKFYDQNVMRGKQQRTIILKSAIDSSPQQVVYPAWLSQRRTIASDFFSNFTLSLSPLGSIDDRQKTLLTFRNDTTKEVEDKLLSNLSNRDNSVNTLSPQLKDAFQKKSFTKYHILLQMKRAGDSLQVLSSRDTGRIYKQYTAQANGPVLPTQDKPTYIVTNDMFNTVSFGLLNGASIILEAPSSGGLPPRVYIFRCMNQVDTVKAFLQDPEKEQKLTAYDAAFEAHQSMYVPLEAELLASLQEALQIAPTTFDLSTDLGLTQMFQTLKEVFRRASAVGLFRYHYRGVPLDAPRDFTGPAKELNAKTALDTMRAQEAMQFQNPADAKAKQQRVYQQDLPAFFAGTIQYDQIGFLLREGETLNRLQKQYINGLWDTLQVLANPETLPILQQLTGWISSLNTYIASDRRFKSPATRQAFNTILAALEKSANNALRGKPQKPIAERAQAVTVAGKKRKPETAKTKVDDTDYEITEVRDHKYEKKGAKTVLFFKVKWSGISEEENKEWEWQPYDNFTDIDTGELANELAKEYMRERNLTPTGPMPAATATAAAATAPAPAVAVAVAAPAPAVAADMEEVQMTGDVPMSEEKKEVNFMQKVINIVVGGIRTATIKRPRLGGQRRTRRRIGGEDEPFYLLSDATGPLLDLVGEFLAPYALAIATDGVEFDDSIQRLLLKYLLLSVQDTYSRAEFSNPGNLDLWMPVLSEIVGNLVLTEDSAKRTQQLQFLLRIWTDDQPLQEVFELPNESWVFEGDSAGARFLVNAFGEEFYTVVKSLPEGVFSKQSFFTVFSLHKDGKPAATAQDSFGPNFEKITTLAIQFSLNPREVKSATPATPASAISLGRVSVEKPASQEQLYTPQVLSQPAVLTPLQVREGSPGMPLGTLSKGPLSQPASAETIAFPETAGGGHRRKIVKRNTRKYKHKDAATN